MLQKVAVLSCLIISTTCMTIRQLPIPVLVQYENLNYHHDNPNYSFSYEVNDAHTGDIKSQQETRRGDIVSGQYSLLQPDGVRRIVDYRADDHRGFRANVNNEGRPVNQNIMRYEDNENDDSRDVDVGATSQRAGQNDLHAPLRPSQNTQNSSPQRSNQRTEAPAPVAISRTSFVQSISNSQRIAQNPWA